MNWKIFFLLVAIIASTLFSYVKFQTLGDEGSEFNQRVRYQLARYPLLRTVFSLHKDGDARAQYLYGREPIEVKIIRSTGVTLDPSILEEFSERIERYIGRSVRILEEETISDSYLERKEADELALLHGASVLSSAPRLLVLYVNDFEDDGEQIGRTVKEYAVMLSDKRIRAITSGHSRTTSSYVSSTLLHEFGHQLGLGHLPDARCMMSDYVESPRSNFTPTFTEFCQAELVELEEIKNRLR